MNKEDNKKIIYSLDARTLAYYYWDDSEWQIKETEKSRIFLCIKHWEWQDDYAPTKITTKKDNNYNNYCKVFDDWSFTVYLSRDWQPLIFEPKRIKWRR
jgi:hypothetical protein